MTFLFTSLVLSVWFLGSHALKPEAFTAHRTQTTFNINPSSLDSFEPAIAAPTCPQAPALRPQLHSKLNAELNTFYATEQFKLTTYGSLAAAIRVPTESYDTMGPVGRDPRWEIFGKLHQFFEDRFSKLYSELQVTKVNTYGLVFHWQGSDSSLLPILLAGHQDVVPVEPATWDQWEHPPYSGHFDGTWIWGRGSCDDKSSVISILVAVEALLKEGFKPKRTIVLAFGFDEESAGTAGAGQLAKYLEGQYGRDGFATLLDEGGGLTELAGGDVLFAVPCTSEKGYTDVLVEVSTPGGHSSVPPKHTGIGILSSAIVAIEASEHTPELLRNGTPFATLQCVAEHEPGIPEPIRQLIKKAAEDDAALELLKNTLVQSDPKYVAELGTTQAVDLIRGGIKVNALPESASAVVNHRIGEHSSVADVRRHLTNALRPIAVQFNLELDAFGVNVTAGSGEGGRLSLRTAFGSVLEPSPVTPTGLSDPFAILSGTIKAVVGNSDIHSSKGVVVTPSLALGNTDTQFYWNLTKHIFRYSHFRDSDVYNGMHTVNEAVRAEGVIEEIRFITTFILNWDEATV